MKRPANPFDWSGGHPALDLVNTLDERPFDTPIENLATYKALVSFTELAGLITPAAAKRLRSLGGPACTRAVRRVRELREDVYAILAAMHDERPAPQNRLGAIAVEIRRAHAARAFTATRGSRGIVCDWAQPTSPEVPLHACALAIEALLLSTDLRRVRKCGASDCAVYFIDTSKAHRRRWCSMQNCGNREKQRRWRAEVA